MFNMMLLFACQLISDLEGDLVSYDRCLKMLEIPQEAEQRKPLPFDWPNEGRIEFVNYSLKYRPETELVLKDLTFEVEGRQKIGIVGRTGAGKSTICLALCRIVEAYDGQILIDGVDISTLGLADLRDHITIIPQEPTLFEGTLRFNLDPIGKLTDLELLKMARKASLEDLINRDDKGLDQKIDDGGKNLSSGEKQLICILRAILRKNKIVLMDEATANIDIKTEQIIQKLIQEEFAESTVLTIAHRLNTIINSDKVLVLDKGMVKEYEEPSLLLEDADSMFYSYANELKKKESE
jgi:ATP-binding cassette, subfamily C (CFTR/MRP), member 1